MSLYIVTGPPGAGKSTVASSLCKKWPKGFHLQLDNIYNMVKGGYLPPWDDDGSLINSMLKGSKKLALSYLADGFNVAVDYVFSPSQLDYFLSSDEKFTCNITLAVLCPSLEKNLTRDSDREHVVGKNLIEKYNQQFNSFSEFSPYLIDNSNISVEQTAEAILNLKKSYFFRNGEDSL